MPSCILNEVLATPTSLSHSSPSSAEGQQLCALLAGHLLNLDGNGALVVVSGVAIIEKVHVHQFEETYLPVLQRLRVYSRQRSLVQGHRKLSKRCYSFRDDTAL